MLIYLKLIRKKDTQFFSFSYSYKTIASISSIQVPLYCLWKKLSKHKNMSCLYSVRINNGKFHTPFRNSFNPLHSEYIRETQFLHFIFHFFLLHRGKIYHLL